MCRQESEELECALTQDTKVLQVLAEGFRV